MQLLRRLLTGLFVAAAIASLWLAIALALRVRVLDDVRDLSLQRVRDADNRAGNAMRLLVLVALPLVAASIVWLFQVGRAATRARGLVIACVITFTLGWLAIVGSARNRPKDAEVRVGRTLDRFIQSDRSAAVGALLLTAAAVLGAVLVGRVTPRRSGPTPPGEPSPGATARPAP